ncbi:MAG: PIN domain-containing protein [Bacteroidetes bacterium]|nr:PIN domain-containing protein [Bacteroidota bacterium]
MADQPIKYYWDACLWIDLINRENQDRVDRCLHVINLVGNKNAELYTSAFTLAEVYKVKCHGDRVQLPENKDQDFEDYLRNNVEVLQVTQNVGMVARRLLREYPKLKKPQDAVHVASCLVYDVDVLHTFDSNHLTRFDDHLICFNGKRLSICEPPQLPNPKDLFDIQGTSPKFD